MRILLAKTPRSTSSLSIGPRSRRAAKKRNELPPELRDRGGHRVRADSHHSATTRATIVRDVNRIFRAAFVALGGGLS